MTPGLNWLHPGISRNAPTLGRWGPLLLVGDQHDAATALVSLPACGFSSHLRSVRGSRYSAETAIAASAGTITSAPAAVVCSYTNVNVQDTPAGISVQDVTPQIRACLEAHFKTRRSSQRSGVVHILSRHTTTAVSINEDETRLRDDIVEFLQKLAPSDFSYKHNDLHLRPASEKDRAAIERNWMSKGKGSLEEFMAQEPINAHSHILAMMLGQSETIPVVGGELALGQWQSVLFIDLDGPRNRTLGVQVMG